MKDVGVPRLQQKCLSVISDMRLEEDLILAKMNRLANGPTSEVEVNTERRRWSPTG